MIPTVPFDAVVFDANGIIGLAKAGCLARIPLLVRKSIVPSQVVPEITDPVSLLGLQSALASWLSVDDPSAQSLQRVPVLRSVADRHVLALALDFQPSTLITGDRAIVSLARRLTIPTVNAPMIIQFLAAAGFIRAARPHLDEMIRQGFGVAPELYASILQALGE